MQWFKKRQFFTLWFGFGIPPFLVGTVIAAFLIGMVHGFVTLSLTILWLYETFSTTCRRCPFYGSAKCGIPSLTVPWIFSKKSADSISLQRVRGHYYADLAMVVWVNYIYAHFPMIFPFVALGSFVGWLVVFGPKKFHGLLFRLNSKPPESLNS